jgi:iron-sulfur cluster assembly protein
MSEVLHQAANKTIPEIHFTEAAINHVLSFLQKKPEYLGVRLSVKSTGCSGLSYVVDYVLSLAEDDLIAPLVEHYVVCVKESSYPFLKNMNVDYLREGLNYRFVFSNPNQTGQCGCGESFTVN